ncbi:hypothetical protein GCM10027605_48500 [Micromonospora zhanjiangensis]
MLCGASDTANVRENFVKVVTDFGGQPWHYLAGHVLHLNSAGASWRDNSISTVQQADLCVFVIVENYGEITWKTELHEALVSGKPFVVLCLDRTYQTYLTLIKDVDDLSAVTDKGKQNLVRVLQELETERQLTIVPFSYGLFEAALRRQLATLFAQSLRLLGDRHRRTAVARMFTDPARLTLSDLDLTRQTAIDELEDKTVRKQAVRALAARAAADEETILTLLSSAEQGVQRLAVQLLPTLYVRRPAEPDFFEHCVALANHSDDVGLARRLIPSLLDIDLGVAVDAISELDLVEVGARRRLADLLERHEAAILAAGLQDAVRALLARCLDASKESDWKTRCRDFAGRLALGRPTDASAGP